MYSCISVLVYEVMESRLDTKKATYNMDADLHQHLKMTATAQRREMVELVEEALGAYFGWNRMTDTEKSELKTYELIEFQGKGQRATMDFNAYSTSLGYSGSQQAVAADLLKYVDDEGRVTVDVFDGGQYKPLKSFPKLDCLYVNGGVMHIKLTIPGRIRYEQLRQRHLAESAQSTVTVAPAADDSIEGLVAKLKSLIGQPTHPLNLHDFLLPIVNETVVKIEGSGIMDYAVHPSPDALIKRVAGADEATTKLSHLFAIGCQWADAAQARIFSKILSRLLILPRPQSMFYSMWEQVARYPALRMLYAGGVAACANDSFEVVRHLLVDTKARVNAHEPELPLVRVMHHGAGFAQDYWKWLPGMERHHTPVSDHFHQTLRLSLSEIANTEEEFAEKFDRFELFQSLIYKDLDDREAAARPWAPLGAFMWRRRDYFAGLRKEIEHFGKDWKPLLAGLFSGSPERALELIDELEKFTILVRNQVGIW
jgi:hypothetical protein